MAYIGKSPVLGNFIKLDAITTSSTATYTMNYGGSPYSPQSVNHMLVSLNGVIQAPSDAYTVSGSTITFSSTLSASDVIDFIMVYGNVLDIGTPSDATVGFSKITSNLITGATAETSIDGADSVLIYDDSATALRKMTRTNFVAGLSVANTPAFKATKSSTTSLTADTYTKVPFNTEVIDTNNCYDNSTNYRFTPNTAGKYLIYGHLWSYMQSTASQSSQFRTALYKNGTEEDTATVLQGTSGNNIQQENAINIVSIQEANGTTDYFEIYVRVSNNAATMYRGEFGAYKLIGV